MERITALKWLITFFATIATLLISVVNTFSDQVSMFLAVTVFALFTMAFELVPSLAVSIVMPMAWVACGVTTPQMAMSGWTSTIVPMVAGAYFLAGALNECGLLKRIAFSVVKRAGRNWTRMLFGVFFAGLAVNVVTFGMGYVIMAALCVGIINSLGLKIPSKESTTVCLACMLGVCSSRCYIYAPSTYAMVTSQACIIDPTFSITPIEAFTQNLPMFFVSCMTLLIASRLSNVKGSLNPRMFAESELSKLGNMCHAEKKAAAFLALFFTLLLTAPASGLDQNLLFAIMPWVLLLPKVEVATELSVSKMPWQSLFFIAACMAIGTVASSLGIGSTIVGVVGPHLSSTGVFGFFAVVLLVVFVLNFFMTPLAIWSLITEPLCELAVGLGISIRPVTYALVMCSEVVLLPYEYVPYLVVYSFGMTSMTEFIKINVMRCVLYVIGFMLLQIQYWIMIGVL